MTEQTENNGNRAPVAIVTGAAKRIGRVLSLELARHGWDIGVHYHQSLDEAESLAGEVRKTGRQAILLQADLSSTSDVQEIVPQCISSLGTPALLINNASLFENDRIEDLTDESWDAHINTNLKAPVLLSQAFANALPQDISGNIINIIDQKVQNLTPYFFSYTISKAGLWTATQTMAQALAPHIRVNAVSPGPVLQSIHQTEEQFARQYRSTPLQRGTTPEEIASAVQFILNAPAMTGQMIILDGGQHLSWKGFKARRNED
ncbi:MAG: SDR family oxidoreductase [Methyloligellaceae bacterium]